ncbi:MAG TPA: ABC transporter permease [Acidimicrobiales bacterium]|nr:ABC transporter permease [Acidimicrobiales bacterium]
MTSTAIQATRLDPRAMYRRVEWLVPLAALVVFQQILFPAPLGVVLNGALVGGRIALIALGIALIYRANRIVNFAQGDLGAVPAVLAVMLAVAWHWNYWLALASGLVAALVLGVLVEGLIIRRFFTAPRLILTVATIGLAQVLSGAGLFLPRAFGNSDFGTQLPQPFSAQWDFKGVVFHANDIFTMIVVPVCLVALALFLQRSRIGVAIVGAAERADRAFTLGIPVKRLHTIVWTIASVLAFLAMFLRAGSVGLPIGQVLPATFLVQALAAAVFGRFERFATIGATAIGLGIVDQSMTFQPGHKDAYNDAVLFVIVLVGLLVTRRGSGTGRVDTDESATWQATREIRPVPRELRRLPEVVGARIALWVLIGGFVLTLPLWMSISQINLATIIVIFGIVAASLVVLTGWAGQVSLGQMAFVGVGAAVGGALTSHRGWDLALAAAVAGVAGGLAAVVVGYPALRRRGLTLAVSTLAFSLFVWSYFLNRTVYTGRFADWLPAAQIKRGTILGIDISGETSMFFVSLVVLALALAMVVGLRHSRTGRVLIAIRENEKAARAYGVNATRTGLAAFALSGFLAAVAGALYVHQQTGLSPDALKPEASLTLFTMVVIGGLGSLPGALLGATYVFSIEFFLPPEWQFLATGFGLLLVLLLFPSGLGGVLADVRDGALRRVAKRRGLIVPSLLADVRVEDLEEAPPEPVLARAGEIAELADEAGGADVDAAALAALSGNGAEPPAPADPPADASANGRGGAPPGLPGTAEGTDGDAVEVRS